MHRKILIVAIAALISCCSSLNADFIDYGDFEGDTVSYLNVTETSLEKGALFGAPEIDGDDLDFPATGFISQSENGSSDLLDGRLNLVVESNSGQEFNSITIEEFGAYLTFGEDSFAFVNAVAFVKTDEGIFQEEFQFSVEGTNAPNGGGWIQSLTVFFPSTTYAELTLDNQLFTIAHNPGAAFIDKKGVNISIGIVPEPTSAAALLALSVALISRRRR